MSGTLKLNDTTFATENAGSISATVDNLDVVTSLTLPKSASDPANPVEGQLYYDTSEKNIKIYNSTNFLSNYDISGGDVTIKEIDGILYKIHTFCHSGNFYTKVNLTLDILIVGGGGSAGSNLSGGGGGGGFIYQTGISLPAGNYPVAVGDGGMPVGGSQEGVWGHKGENSQFYSYIAYGGGPGSGGSENSIPDIGKPIGSGGGGSGYGSNAGGTTTTSQGYNGGSGGGNSPNYPGGGGGGAGAAGQTPSSSSASGGNGGNGVQCNIDGNNYYYAGGGGGGSYTSANGAGNGGYGGGGGGGCDVGTPGVGDTNGRNPGENGRNDFMHYGGDGGTNTGGGGGGTGHIADGSSTATDPGEYRWPRSGKGGSGIVILRYPI